MSVVLMTPEQKKVVVNLSADECLYESPHNLPIKGSPSSSRTDLYAHMAQSGAIYYYTHTWSVKEGSKSVFNLLSEEAAKNFLIERAGLAGYEHLISKKDQKFEKYFPGIFEEDA
ncbi:MAG: hypothetical protein OS112_01390 [Methanoregula sp.]|nr:MAG: hypothetical protein OS112_01390 [Methanoregula sp.]